MYKPLPDNLTIKDSEIHGLGLFATEDIPNDTYLGISHFRDEGNLNRTPLGGFYNHSENPNCAKTIVIDLGSATTYLLETIKDIKAGEELTVKYTFYTPGES